MFLCLCRCYTRKCRMNHETYRKVQQILKALTRFDRDRCLNVRWTLYLWAKMNQNHKPKQRQETKKIILKGLWIFTQTWGIHMTFTDKHIHVLLSVPLIFTGRYRKNYLQLAAVKKKPLRRTARIRIAIRAPKKIKSESLWMQSSKKKTK